MGNQKFIQVLFALTFLTGLGCIALSGPLTGLQQTPTSTPNEDATARAIVTEINLQPSSIAWIKTVNAIGTQGFPSASSTELDGNWKGDGFTTDGTDIIISILVANSQINDITVDYKGTSGASCQLRASATEADFKADFLPANIDSFGSAYIQEWGFNGAFFKDNSASGGIGLDITNQTQAECNIEMKAVWSANK
jgi:hypothetical protein